MDISNLRENYTQAGLIKEDLSSDPVETVHPVVSAGAGSTVAGTQRHEHCHRHRRRCTQLRTVLLKYFDQSGFVFFTNYSSNKSREIAENPHVALMFPWVTLERQVIIKGTAEKISKAESLKYFTSRPHGSQLGAWVSHQSSVITGRKLLEQKLDEMKRKFKEGKVPLPDFWGGYRVVPQTVEFWQGRPNRLHDRFQYTRTNDTRWSIERLAP